METPTEESEEEERITHSTGCEACIRADPCEARNCDRTPKNSSAFACRPGEYRLCKRHHNDYLYNVNRGGVRLVVLKSGAVMYSLSLNDVSFSVRTSPTTTISFNTLGSFVETQHIHMNGTPSASLRLCVSHSPDGTIRKKIHTARKRTEFAAERDLLIPPGGFELETRSENRNVPNGTLTILGYRGDGIVDRVGIPPGTKSNPQFVTFNGNPTLCNTTSIRISNCWLIPEARRAEEHFISSDVFGTLQQSNDDQLNVPKISMKGTPPDFVILAYGTNKDVVKLRYERVEFLNE